MDLSLFTLTDTCASAVARCAKETVKRLSPLYSAGAGANAECVEYSTTLSFCERENGQVTCVIGAAATRQRRQDSGWRQTTTTTATATATATATPIATAAQQPLRDAQGQMCYVMSYVAARAGRAGTADVAPADAAHAIHVMTKNNLIRRPAVIQNVLFPKSFLRNLEKSVAAGAVNAPRVPMPPSTSQSTSRTPHHFLFCLYI